MSAIQSIAVLGAGSWGTALAVSVQSAGRDVKVWARSADLAASLKNGLGNPAYLPGLDLPALNASASLDHLDGAEAVLAAVPAQHARPILAALAPHLKAGTPVILCAKGIERGTLKLMQQVLGEALPHAVPAVLSGPSFAADVARDLPTAVTLACADPDRGRALMQALGRETFRPYWSGDMVGAEVGGAVKNVLAIACGMVEGLALGRSAHAALMTRGFAEMKRLATALGGRPETLAGLCGLGDLVLTCSSAKSRNMSFGKALGEGRSAQDVLAERRAVTEGAATAPALAALAARHGVDMPICAAVNAILDGQITVAEAMDLLLSRPFKEEH
ncbi:MAG: NAD(P)H-dependent glycerol-3-phosphate dehydrogenase [Pseudomonadota bacterium]